MTQRLFQSRAAAGLRLSTMGLLVVLSAVQAQDFTQRGFLEFRPVFYPQDAPGDSGNIVLEALFRYTLSYKLAPGVQFNLETDARSDTHRMVERSARFDLLDRGIQRPALSLRRASVNLNRGHFTLELGKQFIRWGKTDILNPTDRFAPRDYLSVVDNNDFLGVLATRLTYEQNGNTLDLVYTPRFTPSRVPLLNQRWTVLPETIGGAPVRFVNMPSQFPGGGQYGVRFDHIGRRYDASVSYFEGYNHLPLIDAEPLGPVNFAQTTIGLEKFYPKIRMVGADVSIPLSWVTLKGETGYFSTKNALADEYILYVIQVERQAGEWILVGGYAGQEVTTRRTVFDFAPDRGLTSAFLGRAAYTIDPRRSLAFEGAVRDTGDGVWLKFEYSQLLGQHWRATGWAALIRGDAADFLGQYRRNSHLGMTLRYSF